jgi:FdhE protein
VTLETWLQAHPFLQPIARLHARVDAVAKDVCVAPAIPDWTAYDADFSAGVPLLKSAAAAVDLEPLERGMAALQGRLEPEIIEYGERLVFSASLLPLVMGFEQWRDDDRWLHAYCPTCGSRPAMAQLAGTDPGRRRYLFCGQCASRWRFGRTICPFCEHEGQRLASLAIEGESGLRLDHCEVCRAYLKTYDGQGQEAVLLADWTSLHLDVLARERGLVRAAASLYDLDSGPMDLSPVFSGTAPSMAHPA